MPSETPRSVLRTTRRVFALDPDVLNVTHLTPHHWTEEGRDMQPADVIQPDLHYWTYRNQVLAVAGLAPWQLFAAVKLTEALFHLRPRALWRMAFGRDRNYRRILRAYLVIGIRVCAAEVVEFIREIRLGRPGSVAVTPGYPRSRRTIAIRPAEGTSPR